jgi:HlyD family secretion protein
VGDEQAIFEKLNNLARTLTLRLTNSAAGVLSVRAPYQATVISVVQRNAGSVVRAGQELCQMARLQDRSVAELQLAQTGLDRVKQGRTAQLFFDAFPYERYGTLGATIDWVSPTAVAHGDQWQFSARAVLKQSTFFSHGQPLEVRAGMMGEARIRVDSRTVLDSVFEPLRALREQTR